MSSLTDVVNALTNANKNVSALVMAIQNALPVGGANARLKSYLFANLPNPTAEGAGTMLYVSNATGGAIPAYSDGVNWRRVDTMAIVT